MDLTLLLARVFGLYMIIAGIAIFMNRKEVMLGIVAIVQEKFAQLIAGFLALLFGIFLINIHNDWSSLPAIVVTLIGWLAVLKGLVYLFLPDAKLAKITKQFRDRKWYTIDGVVTVILGIYLAGIGYEWF